MDDPSRFTSINEYYTFIYAISYMMLVELGIWIYNFKGWLKRPDKKNNDYGTIDCNAGVLGEFLFQHLFQKPTVYTDSRRNTFTPYFLLCGYSFYSCRYNSARCCCLEPKIFFHTFRQNGRQSTVSHNWRLPIY